MPERVLSVSAHAPLRERKLRAAIEDVFRRTHGREMTAEERLLFGIPERQNGQHREGTPDKAAETNRARLAPKRRS